MVEDNDTRGDDNARDDTGTSGQSDPADGPDRAEGGAVGGQATPERAGQPTPQSGGGGSWLPGGARWTPLAVLALVVLVGGVAAAGVFVATGGNVPLLGSDAGGSASLDSVPAEVDMVLYVDSGIVEDGTTATLVDGTLNASGRPLGYAEPADYDDLIDQVDNETDLDIDAFDSATMFAAYPEESSGTEYAGAIVESDWSESDLLSTIESEGQSVEERSYDGTTVYVQTPEFGTETWIAPLGDGTFAIGSQAAVTDAIDVETGDASAFDGDLRDSYEELRDGYVKFAATLPADAAGSGYLPQAGQLSQNVQSATGVYYTDGSDIGVRLHLTGTDQSGAQSVQESIDGLLSFVALGQQDSAMADVVDAVELSRDGQEVTVSFEYAATELVSAIEATTQGSAPA